jgi:hypothetical protein
MQLPHSLYNLLLLLEPAQTFDFTRIVIISFVGHDDDFAFERINPVGYKVNKAFHTTRLSV